MSGVLSRVIGMASSVAGALRRGARGGAGNVAKKTGVERQVDEVVNILAPGPLADEMDAASDAIERARHAWKESRRAGTLLEEAMGRSGGRAA
jgi:hypothetical protein